MSLANENAEPPALPDGKPGVGNDAEALANHGILDFLPASWRHEWLFGLFLVVVTLIAYGPAWRAGYVWDDDAYLTQNPLLTAPDGLRRIWFSLESPSQYFPLTYTTFYIERALWGLHPAGYHLINLLLHAANAVLVWRVLTRLRVPGAWLAAAIFALHPVQVESAAWITERKNVLMGLFFLLTLWEWVRFIDEKAVRPWRYYSLALVFYALALSAKTTACTLPAALLLILWLKKMPIGWRSATVPVAPVGVPPTRTVPVVALIAPFVAMGIGMGLLTVWWERFHQGTQGSLFGMGPVERVLLASRAVWFYAGKLLWPANLTFSYPRWTISASDPRAYGWVLATAALGVVIWQARRWTGRSVEVAAVFFVATLSPLLGFFMLYTFLYSFVADHYQYLACIGPIALAAAGMKIGLGRVGAGKPFLEPLLGVTLLMALGALTWKQCGMYANIETLWQTTIRLNPEAWMAHDNLGHILLLKGKVDEAIPHFQKALQIQPGAANPHFNFGNALRRMGRMDEAIAQFQNALQIRPDFEAARVNLGKTLFQVGKVEEAIAQYQIALQTNPGDAEGHYDLGVAFLQEGKVDDAIIHFQDALQIRPNYALAQNYLGNAFLRKGRAAEAISYFQKALQIEPDNPAIANNLAWLLATWPEASVRNGKQAVQIAERANQLASGGNPFILCTLAAAYAEAGRFSEAVETAQRALHLAEAQSNTGLAGQLQTELKLYRAGSPFHLPEQARKT